MIKKILLNIFLALIIYLIFLGVFTVQAQAPDYTVLAPLPGTTIQGDDTKANLSSYIPGLFNLIIGLAAVIAVAYIIWGGFQYITTDAIQGKSEGKARITNAIYGLFMVCIAWLILYTINPRLLTFDLNIDALSVPSSPGGTLTDCTGCVGIPPGLHPSGAGAMLTADTLSKVQALNTALGAGAGFRITDATGMQGGLPVCGAGQTTGCHRHPCHGNGTCVDANVSDPTVLNITSFITQANQAGLTAIYEVADENERRRLINLGVHCQSIIAASITAPHFSVYNTVANSGRCP